MLAALVLLASPLAGVAADTPEEVYAKFHAATMAGDVDGMKKYGTAEKGADLSSPPSPMQQMLLSFMRNLLPKSYSIDRKTVGADGNRTTLEVSAMQQPSGKAPEKVTGRVTLVKEQGEWRVDTEQWGDARK
jgi:hypothetical protein